MKTNKFKITSLFAPLILLAALAFSPPAGAQTQFDFLTSLFVNGRPASVVLTAVSTDTALLVRYVGAQVSGIVDVAANGDVTFKHGAVGAEVVDTSVECDASIAATGSRSGIWDVSIAACNTIAEGGGIINAQVTATGVHNWIIIPLDALGTDDLDWSGNGGMVTVTGVNASTADGIALKWDTAVTFTQTIALLPPEARLMSYYTVGTLPTHIAMKSPNPFVKNKTLVGSVAATSTYGSGTSALTISEVLPIWTQLGTFSSTVTTLFPSTAGGASTVLKQFIALTDNFRVQSADGQKIIVRLLNSAALTAPAVNAYGIYYPTQVSTTK